MTLEFPTKRYSVIYADPPWQYAAWSGKKTRTADSHYPVMSLAEIAALDVGSIARKNCALFLWVTNPFLPVAFMLFDAWKFTYKTVAFVWVKTYVSGKFYFGMGHSTRSGAEVCLLAMRGALQRKSASVRQVRLAHNVEHSRKPLEFGDDIVELYGNVKRIELFARSRVKGWDAWGNQV